MPIDTRKSDSEKLLALRTHLTARSVAELDELATFWLGKEHEPGDPAATRLALAEAMTTRETVAGHITYLFHEDRQLLRQLANRRGYRCQRSELLARPVGAVAPDPLLLDGSLERLRVRGFLECQRLSSWGGKIELEIRVPHELAEELRTVLGGARPPIDRYTSCASYMRSLSHNQLEERLARVSRAGGREEQIKRAIARCRSWREVERRREQLPPDLAELVAIVRDDFHGLAFREEIQALRPDLTTGWDESIWREALEDNLLGTAGMFSLVDHGLRRHGEAVVIFSEAVAASRRHREADGTPPSNPERVHDLGFDFLSLIDRLLAMVQIESVKVTQKDCLLFKGTRRRLREAFAAGREDELFQAEDTIDWAVRFAARQGLVDVDDAQRLTLQAAGSTWVAEPPHQRLRRVLNTMLGEAVALSRAPISSDFVLGIVGGLSAERWTEATAFHRRFRANLAALRLPEGRSHHLQGAQVGEPEQSGGAGTEEDAIGGLLGAFLAPFHAGGCLQLGTRAGDPGTITHLRLSPVAAAIFADEPAVEMDEGEKVLLINPDCEVMVFPPETGSAQAFYTQLERCADLLGGEGIRRYNLSREGVRRAIVLGGSGEHILAMLQQRARAPLPSNVEYSLREWSASIEFVPAEVRVLMRTATRETADRIVMLATSRGVPAEHLGDRIVALPAGTLGGADGASFREALRDAGVLVTDEQTGK